MRVLHVYKTYPPVLGGIEGHVALLARHQARRGHEVTVLVTGRGPTRERVEDAGEEDDGEGHGVRVVRCRRLAELRSMPLSVDLWRRVRSEARDVTHLHVPFPLGELAHGLGRRVSHNNGAATVVTYHSDIVRQRLLGGLYRPFLVRLLRRADRILVTSPPYLESSPVLRRVAAGSAHRCRVVPLGIDIDAWSRPEPARVEAVRARGSGPLVLFVGRLRLYKGLEDLVAAIAALPEARLLVVGDGPARGVAERRARRLGCGARIRFAGDVEQAELAASYAAADVLVLPSRRRSEAFGLVLLEAMAAGLPAISTELGTGTSWVNRDGETGLVVPPRAPEALARAIAALLADPERRRAMGAAGRRRVVERFSAARMVDRVLDVYRTALAGDDEG